jgi:hypothetical protein
MAAAARAPPGRLNSEQRPRVARSLTPLSNLCKKLISTTRCVWIVCPILRAGAEPGPANSSSRATGTARLKVGRFVIRALRYRFNDCLGLLATASQRQLPGRPTFRPSDEKGVYGDPTHLPSLAKSR